jgi:hypothetical protein
LEKRLVKAAIYGFLIGIGVMILFTPYEIVIKDSGAYTTIEIPTKRYIITLLQNTVLFTFAILISTFITQVWKKSWVIHILIFISVFILTMFLIQFIRT